MSRRFRPGSMILTASEVSPIIRLWLLRILVPLGGHRDFLSQHGFTSDGLAASLGLSHWIDLGDRDFDPKAVRSELRKLHEAVEKSALTVETPSCLKANVHRLAELVGLSPTDCRVLEFSVMIHNERLLDDTADWLGTLSSVKVFHALAVILGLPEPEVRAALSAQGVLARSGLVTMERCGSSQLRSKLDLLSDSFADHILSSETDPVSLLRETVSIVEAGQLTLADYSHVSQLLSILCPYLRQGAAKRWKGVNIFIYGAPGTGKSELARALAKDVGCDLFEVASEDGDGDPVNGELRLRAFRAAQSFFSNQCAMIVFDEVQDVFDDGDRFFGRKSTAQTRKAWINRMLEENPVPTLWLSNSIACLDPAFVRRFDMVIELPVPPRSQRQRLLTEECADLVSAPTIVRIAEVEALAPAIVTRAASVIRSIKDELGESGTSPAFELLIGNTLAAQGHPPLKKQDPSRLPEVYDPAFINANSDLVKVSIGLIKNRSGRLCLYGPPGTGKTAYGRWLADQLGVPLTIKRASDLLSKWLGQAEKNIAKAFNEAEAEGALLMIDEVDSFLQDRRKATRSWEVAEVNEMLTQIESFSGVFVASTNLVSGLDQAALRRFDLKVKFDFMRPDQIGQLFTRYCNSFGISIGAGSDNIRQRVTHIKNMTPGDFSAVARQHRFRPIESMAEFALALESECGLKEGSANSIGFIQ